MADGLRNNDLLYEDCICARRFQTGASCTSEQLQQFDTCQIIPPTCSGNEYKGGPGDDGDHLTQAIHSTRSGVYKFTEHVSEFRGMSFCKTEQILRKLNCTFCLFIYLYSKLRIH